MIYLLLILSFLTSPISDDWKLIKTNDRFKVYVRKPDNALYEQIKIVAVTDAEMKEVVAALEDIDHHKNWVYGTGESYIIRQNDYNDIEYYVTVEMPFPVKDRDVTIQLKRRKNKKTGVVSIESHAVDGLKEEIKNHVRIQYFKSSYILSPLDGNRIEIEYFLDVDPGGTLPAWVVNLVTTKGPTETMKALLNLLDSDYYAEIEVEGLN